MRAALTASALSPPLDPVLSAIEAHKAAWADFSAVAQATARARFMSKGEARRKAARDLYEARTDTLVRTPIATMAGLQAFTAYLASLQAYGMAWPTSYAVETWHLSDAMEAVADALARLVPLDLPTSH